jgi:hypothetical protein
MTATAEATPAAEEASSSEDAEIQIPTNLPSACGMDYVPLATMLATGDLVAADQVSFFCFDEATYLLCILLLGSSTLSIIKLMQMLCFEMVLRLQKSQHFFYRFAVHSRCFDRNFGRQSQRSQFCLLHRRQKHPQYRSSYHGAAVE